MGGILPLNKHGFKNLTKINSFIGGGKVTFIHEKFYFEKSKPIFILGFDFYINIRTLSRFIFIILFPKIINRFS